MKIPGVAFEPIDRSLYPSNIKSLPRIQMRIADVLLKGTPSAANGSEKSWALSFLKAPKSMDANSVSGHLSSITFANRAFAPDTDTSSPSASVVPAEGTITYSASLAFRSIGYKSAALPGLSDLGVPFDSKLGIIPNDPHGRIITPSGGPENLAASHLPGLYCAGWVKRGPTGVILSTMMDAFASADIIVNDWTSSVPFLNTENGVNKSTGLGWNGIKDAVLHRGARPVSWQDWKRIDETERVRGRELGKEREKFVNVADMMRVLDRY